MPRWQLNKRGVGYPACGLGLLPQKKTNSKSAGSIAYATHSGNPIFFSSTGQRGSLFREFMPGMRNVRISSSSRYA
jgi:hypothetical protein